MASDAWQEGQVVREMVVGKTVEVGLSGGSIRCSPWQSAQVGAPLIPRSAATPCTLAA